MENRIKAYAFARYDCPKSDGLTKGVKLQDKNAGKTDRYDARPSACLSVFYRQLIPISSVFVNIFTQFKADTCSSGF